ncbi:MAG: PLP-dependent transferase [Prosthecobacter sp.]|jgi:cystathionine beta-lyase/cystathionine gamma-synthase|uniref:trans-sulfuration enzyme family protein n=1 Tax=Prosthecobacter sp. TaxID=1965333 RepID=UPI0019F41364|nr:PLP-dependent aspartate aminotransferase family protein [Prosthecobacter sp.]MBE2284288.1 PLP-dependent transferase [Prosthecobacter sp.]
MKEDPTIPPDARFETRAIHVGQDWRSETGAVIPPIYMTSTFETGNPGGFDYTRSGNPNFRNLQATLASLENAKHCTAFASGISSISAIMFSLKAGDVILSEEQIYGATYRLFERVLRRFNITIKYANLSNPANYGLITQLKPALVWLESPTNPLLKVLDIQAISDVAHSVGSVVAVDNTFASSLLQQPLDLGADLSQLSTTKYTNGHSDCLGGAVCTNNDEWQEKMIFAQKALGLQPSPFDAWLVARGAKTEAVRLERHSANALELARRLEGRKGVKGVKYPFLPSHPQHELAKKQMKAGSGMLLADFGLSYADTLAFIRRLRLFTQAESLGGIESLVAHPASMTHASIPKETREAAGVTDGLVRFSVGIEHVEDLWADIDAALAKK